MLTKNIIIITFGDFFLAINSNGRDVTVSFPQQSQWTGLIAEMELVSVTHDNVM